MLRGEFDERRNGDRENDGYHQHGEQILQVKACPHQHGCEQQAQNRAPWDLELDSWYGRVARLPRFRFSTHERVCFTPRAMPRGPSR
jgi:hypothetical protein